MPSDVNSDMEDEGERFNADIGTMTPSKKMKIEKSLFSGAFALSSPPPDCVRDQNDQIYKLFNDMDGN